MNFLDEKIPDATDFPDNATAPGLRQLDSAFRCSICGEIFDAPVVIKCGHCFCSTCLRTALGTKQECPQCREPANEGHIRPNRSMEESLTAWSDSRQYVLDLIAQIQRPPSEPTSSSPRKRKRRRSPSTSSIDLTSASVSAESSKQAAARSSSLNDVASTDDEVQEVSPALDSKKDCPACGKRVVFRELNAHLDRNCEDPPILKPKSKSAADTASAWSKLMQPKGKGKQKKQNSNSEPDEDAPLPKVSYSTLRDRQLKDLLAEHGLPTQGERSLLEQRHQRWVTIYNANLDRTEPKRKDLGALRSELRKWEDTMHSRQKKPVVKNAVEHTRRHKPEFARLTELARPPPKQDSTSSPAVEEPQTNDSGPISESSSKSSVPESADDSVIVIDE